MTKKILLVLDHAPNYREGFLRELCSQCDLTVVAQACEKDNLVPPLKRGNYEYIELKKNYGKRIRFNFELAGIVKKVEPDLICIALNFRHPIRLIDFFRIKRSKMKWVWWGQVFGKNDTAFLINLKEYLIRKSDGCLVYTKDIVHRLNLKNVQSFDNSQFSKEDYLQLTNDFSGKTLKCLFVGRPQERKRLDIFFKIAQRFDFIKIRLVGPKMKGYFHNLEQMPPNIELYEAATGEELKKHFQWSNLVMNPGHVGLLVMNAACHNRPIVIDSKVDHAPEVVLAKEADQFFIDFSNDEEIKEFFNRIFHNDNILLEKGEDLYEQGLREYTTEYMAEKHLDFFKKVLRR